MFRNDVSPKPEPIHMREEGAEVEAPCGGHFVQISVSAVASNKANADSFAKNVAPIIREIQGSGIASRRAIARALNARGVATARGGQWTAVQVGSILQRA